MSFDVRPRLKTVNPNRRGWRRSITSEPSEGKLVAIVLELCHVPAITSAVPAEMNMRTSKKIRVVAVCLSLMSTAGLRAEEDYQKDSPEGLPPDFAKNYLIARNTVPPDGKFAVIYPTVDFSGSKEAKDFFVALNPFRVLAPLPTDEPYFENKNHGGVGADWSSDSSAVLITLDSKWGPSDVFLIELSGDKVKRITNMLQKTRELLRPKFRGTKPKPEPYNDLIDFVFLEEEGGACNFQGKDLVRIYTRATNDPKGDSKKPWNVVLDAKWDIAQAKFLFQKIKRVSRWPSD